MKFMIRNEFLMFHFGESVFFLGGFSSTNLGEFDSLLGLTRKRNGSEQVGPVIVIFIRLKEPFHSNLESRSF